MNRKLNIERDQWTQENLDRIRGYSYAYLQRRRYRRLRVSVALVLAVGVPIAIVLEVDPLIAAAAGVWAIFSRLILVPRERAARHRAARAHEFFEVEVFDLRWPGEIAGPKPEEARIATLTRQYDKWAGRWWRRLRRELWRRLMGRTSRAAQPPFPKPLAESPNCDVENSPNIAVALCQRFSTRHRSGQHRLFARLALAATIVVGVLLLVLLAALTSPDERRSTIFLVSVVLAVAPALVDLVEIRDAHREQARSDDDLDERLQNVIRESLADERSPRPRTLRRIQTAQFLARRNGPPPSQPLFMLLSEKWHNDITHQIRHELRDAASRLGYITHWGGAESEQQPEGS